MERVITFRPTEEVASILKRKKDEGCNISAWLNQTIALMEHERAERDYSHYWRIIPSTHELFYHEGIVMMASLAPVGQLNIKQYKEYLSVLKSEGLELFKFHIDENLTMSIVSANREEASVELSKYFTRASEKEPYVRTPLPLPMIYYDRTHKTVLIRYYEPIQSLTD
jgi:hypothetical protein